MATNVKRITVLGAGQMGSGAAAVFAQEVPVYLLNRAPLSKAQAGIEIAVNLARSNSLRFAITPGTFEDDLQRAVGESDLVLEMLGEDMRLKRRHLTLVDRYRKPGTIVATGSSGLSVAGLAEGMSADFHRHFLCVHLYNPPTRMTAVELVPGPETLPEVVASVAALMDTPFRRGVVHAKDTPGYAGNRIGFKVLNEVAQLVSEHGVAYLDYVLGSYTGRLLPPLATIDLVGWDVHKALVDNVYHHTHDEAHQAFQLPAFMEERIHAGFLGNKTPAKGGFYKRENGKMLVLDLQADRYVEPQHPKIAVIEEVKDLIRYGNYQDALVKLLLSKDPSAAIARRVLLGYVSYSGMRNGEVSDMHGINRVMGFGFNWMPPDAFADLVGVEAMSRLLVEEGLPVPPHWTAHAGKLYVEEDDVPRYLAGR